MSEYNLFMVLTGCRPKGRNIEQHDIFFGIARELRDLVPAIKESWKGVSPVHVDAWRIVNNVDGYRITVAEKSEKHVMAARLYFLNLGGYKENQFEEFHYKMLAVSPDLSQAALKAKQTAFFLHTGMEKPATAHIDDRFGVDADDAFEVKEILSEEIKNKFTLLIEKNAAGEMLPEDEIHLGFFRLHEL